MKDNIKNREKCERKTIIKKFEQISLCRDKAKMWDFFIQSDNYHYTIINDIFYQQDFIDNLTITQHQVYYIVLFKYIKPRLLFNIINKLTISTLFARY